MEKGKSGLIKEEKISNPEYASEKEKAFSAFNVATQLMAICNPMTGKFIDVNEAFLRTLGYSKNEIIGKTSDEIHVFASMEHSSKYLNLLAKFKKVTDFPLDIKLKNGTIKPFLLSAETVRLDDEFLLLATYDSPENVPPENKGSLLKEVYDTIGCYMVIFRPADNGNFLVVDMNLEAEKTEQMKKEDLLNINVTDTPLSKYTNLITLLSRIHATGEPHKVESLPAGNNTDGNFMGFLLSNGDIFVTWDKEINYKAKSDHLLSAGKVFDKLANLLPEIIYEIDVNGKVTYANSQGLEYFGYTNDDLEKGLNISELFPPEEYKRAMENLQKISMKNQNITNECVAIKKNNTLVPILTRTFGIFSEDKLVGYRGVVTDITMQKKNEEQIIREKAFLEHLVDSTPEAIVITDIPGKITLINKEFTNLFGYTNEEAVGRYIDDLVVPDELKDEAIRLDEETSKKRKVTIQTVRHDKYGNRINVSLIASNIIISDVTVALLGIYRDITAERKNQLIQEILYNISTAALKQFEIRDIYTTIVSELNKIWDTDNFYIVLYDKDTCVLSLPFFSDEKDDFNEIPAKGTITGWVINNNRSVLLREEDMKRMEDSGEIDLVGTPCKVWMGAPLRVDNEIIGVMCLQDYNREDKFSKEDLNVLDFIANQIAVAIQRRTMLDNLIVARQKAEDAAKSKQLFMSTMSHEIRTPLNEVIGISNLLMQSNPSEEQLDLVKTLRFSANHLMTLVNDVLDYNKMELGKIVFEQTQFNLAGFIDELKKSYSFRANEKKLDFTVITSNKVPSEVIGDQIRLNQILSNLLSNALKFTLKGGITVTIDEIERSGTQSKIEFRVTDTGIGIPRDKHDEIFESFTQASADTTRLFGGTGLGLAICKRLIELQGGSIRVESVPEKGSSFIFNLIFGVAVQQSASRTSGHSENFRGLEGKKILVAEDNKINFYVANKFLAGWGVQVSHAENGQLAIDMLNKDNYDLILMDLHMPILDGIEASRIIRGSDNPAIKNIPIIALTAAIMSESHDRIDDLNINDYVLKPFKPQDLYDRILKHVR